MTYAEKLKDPRWQKKRLELMQAADFKCTSQFCRSKPGTSLNVHHKVYLRGKMPWEYENWMLQVLCETCHEIEQNHMEEAHVELARNSYLSIVCGRLSLMKDKDLADKIAESVDGLLYLAPGLQAQLPEELDALRKSKSKAYLFGRSVEQAMAEDEKESPEQ